jgi:hypothetical protein
MTAPAAQAAEKPHCGETCPVLDFMTVVCNDRMTLEERMEAAIKACTDHGDGNERMSQKAAAKKFGVAQQTLSYRLAKATKVGSSATSPAPQAISETPGQTENSGSLTTGQKRTALRALAREHDIPKGVGAGQGISSPQARAWLDHIGVPVPPELDGIRADIDFSQFTASTQTTATTTHNDHGTEETEQGLSATDEPAEAGRDNTDLFGDECVPAHELDYGVERARDLQRVLASNNLPDSLKESFKHLYDAHTIIGIQFFQKDGSEWDGHDWVRINSSIEAIRSLTRQRAEEFHRQVFPETDRPRNRKGAVA